jgi:predicted lipoprotein with Yx(FWY)xxD motif
MEGSRAGIPNVMDTTHRPWRTWQRLGLRLAGGGLLIATGAIHLDLYLTGYRTIPTIGWLFLLQVIAAFVLGAGVLVLGSRLVAAAGAGFALSTLGGYLLSIWVGLFGFKEVRTTAGIVAGVIEILAFAVLAAMALVPAAQRQPVAAGLHHAAPGAHRAGPGAHRGGLTGRTMAGLRDGNLPGAWAGAAALSVLAVVLLVVAAAGAGSPSSAPSSAAGPGQVLKTAKIGGVTVLTSAKGLTLYLFVPDNPTTSKCYGSCAQYWPPVLGTPKAGPGVTGTLGTIKRSDGTTQATYNGHPLYTYIADSGPGQAHGNNINLNGGLWKDLPVSG